MCWDNNGINILCQAAIAVFSLFLELNRLDFEKLLQPVTTQFPTVTGLFAAAEWREQVEAPAVYIHLTGLETAGKMCCPFCVT